MIIAIDFDGTICENAFPAIGKELPDAVRVIDRMQKEGHKIIVWTCRESPHIAPMIFWLKDRGIIPDAINENIDKTISFARHKVYADIYIDDRSLGALASWKEIELVLVQKGVLSFQVQGGSKIESI